MTSLDELTKQVVDKNKIGEVIDGIAKMTLEDLIDQVLADNHSVRVFRSVASVGRDQTSFVPDQLAEEAKPSEKLRDVLEQVLRVGRWAWMAKDCSYNPLYGEITTTSDVPAEDAAMGDLLDDL